MMDVKKFEAPTLAEVLKVVKRELGPEAVILSTKNNRGGWGLMNKASVEVTATVSAEAFQRKTSAESGLTESQRESLLNRPARRVTSAYDVLSGARLNRRLQEANSFVESVSQKVTHRASAQSAQLASAKRAQTSSIMTANQLAALNKREDITQRRYVDIEDDESPAEQISMRSVDRANFRQEGLQRGQTTNHQHIRPSSISILPKVIAQLIESGIQEDLVKEIGDELKAIMLREHITREDLLRLQLARVLMGRIRVGRALGERLRSPSTPRVITFLGPTGVGKTTTIAKIAAELVINQKRPITLATTDTFKIAAVEQLQTYANILNIPLEVCPNADALESLKNSLGPDDVVLVDTAGFGPRDDQKLAELRDTLRSIRTEIHLCVSSTTRDGDLLNAVKRFQIFEPDYLVFTKLDETQMYGNIFNLAARSHLPLSYFTMGQRVPEDMEVATKERVADLILDLAGGGSLWTKQID